VNIILAASVALNLILIVRLAHSRSQHIHRAAMSVAWQQSYKKAMEAAASWERASAKWEGVADTRDRIAKLWERAYYDARAKPPKFSEN